MTLQQTVELTIAEQETVQPLAPVTVTVYVAAGKFEIVEVVPPLLHIYVYGEAPPVAVAVAEPVFGPLQFAFIDEHETPGAAFTLLTMMFDSPT